MATVSIIRRPRSRFSPIGLDIGASSVRAAQLRWTGGRWTAVTLCHWPLSTGDEQAADAAIWDRLAQWLRRVGFKGRKTVLGLSPPDVELHALDLPSMESATADDISAAAHHEIERLMSFEPGEAETDLWSIPPSKVARTTAIGVAAKKSSVERLVSVCDKARLDCIGVDATACGLARFGWVLRGEPRDQPDVWGVLDLGARRSRLIVCVDAIPVLARSFDYGGQVWTERLAEAMGVTPQTAERHKRDHGISPLSREGDHSGVGTGVLSEMIYNALRRDLDAMVDELERSYRYVMRSYPQRQLGPLLLVGGGAQLQNLDQWLTQRLGVPVVTPTFGNQPQMDGIDLSRVATGVRDPGHAFACAIGLALHPEQIDA